MMTSQESDIEYDPANGPMAYAPYTPSKKSSRRQHKANDAVTLSSDMQNESYCPEPIVFSTDPSEMPKYKAKPIRSMSETKRRRPHANNSKNAVVATNIDTLIVPYIPDSILPRSDKLPVAQYKAKPIRSKRKKNYSNKTENKSEHRALACDVSTQTTDLNVEPYCLELNTESLPIPEYKPKPICRMPKRLPIDHSNEEVITPTTSDFLSEPYVPDSITSSRNTEAMPQYKAKPIASWIKTKRARPPVNYYKEMENSPLAYNNRNINSKKSKDKNTGIGTPTSDFLNEPYCPEAIKSSGNSSAMPQDNSKSISSNSKAKRSVNRSNKKPPIKTDNSESLKQLKSAQRQRNMKNFTTTTSESECLQSDIFKQNQQEPQLDDSSNLEAEVNSKENIRKKIKRKKIKSKIVDLFGATDEDEVSTASSNAAETAKPKESTSNLKLNPKSYIATSSGNLKTEMNPDNERMEKFNMLEELCKIIKPKSPKKVTILLLKDMNKEDILKTYHSYESELAKIYKVLTRKTDTVYSYKGVCHMLVMDLIERNIEEEMLTLLGNCFHLEATHKDVNIKVNALLPTWILLIFMNKYKMNRDDAIAQIDAQQKYTDYLKWKTNPSNLSLIMP